MSKIYTKSGDKGSTSLVSGERKLKSDFQIDLYGDVDELNSIIGIVASCSEADINTILFKIQNQLFDLGSNLACTFEKRTEYKLPQLSTSDVKVLEEYLDNISKELDPLNNFILPGGSQSSAFFHLARTVCRRVERKLVGAIEASFEAPENALIYLNRLSDLFFVMSRVVNARNGVTETLWQPRK